MRVCLATGHDPNYSSLAAITLPSWRNYCKKHGYYLLYDGEGTDKDACKVRLFQQAYATGNFGPDDVFCWVDTDGVCTNSDRRIESIVYEHMPRNIHFLIGVDVNEINSGFYIARFSPEAHLFLTVSTSLGAASGWGDQFSLKHTALEDPHRSIYKTVPGKVFNCNLYGEKGWSFLGEYGNYINAWEPGDFVAHPAGVEEPRRSQLLREVLAQAK
jgi:hypothetical protein